jgi:hypothetical protein
VNDGSEMGVIKVKGVGSDAMDQCGACHVDTLTATGDAGLRSRLQHMDGRQRSARCCVVTCANGASEPIEKSTMRFVLYRIRPSFRRMGGDKFSQDLGDGGCVVVCDGVGIGSHRGESIEKVKWVTRSSEKF